MKDILVKILKFTLIATAVILLVLLIFGLVLFIDWPWWMGIFITLGLIGLLLGFIFIRKLLLRKREQQFVQEIIAQDRAFLDKASGSEKEGLKELQQRWKEAIRTLRKSHLKRFGNPLYVLPWYMIIGESGSGKTTAISSSGLSSPFAETIKTAGITGTRNCDWWFFEQAVILDTAGRYALPVEAGRDRDEWQKFLGLLAKYRKKEPLNGLVVTVSADKLLSASSDALERDGAEIRKRIDELMRVLGVKFPVYLMVTKCDLIQGMSAFCDMLPEGVLNQAMGMVNEDGISDPEVLAAQTVERIGQQLRDLRLMLIESRDSSRRKSSLLLFPEEFEGIRPGLTAFARGAFEENPYQETPILRGMYFSSGRQEGTPYSHFLSSLGLIQKQEVLPGTNRGLFLHDFFAKILPGDRGLLAPTKASLSWQGLTRNLGLASWVALGIALGGLLSFSFVKNLWTLREVSREFSSPVAITGRPLTDLMTLDRFSGALIRIEEQNKDWWIPRFGLNESLEVEKGLKQKYCAWFHDTFLKQTDNNIAVEIAAFSSQTPDEVLAAYLPYVVRRINLAQAYLAGKRLGELSKMPLPGITPGLKGFADIPVEEVTQRLNRLFLYYLAWNRNKDQVSTESEQLKAWLRHLFSTTGLHLRWTVTWINEWGKAKPVTFEDFWGGPVRGKEEPVVNPAYTRKGHEVLGAFLEELEGALDDPLLIARQKRDLYQWYWKNYQDAWLTFASNFSKGTFRLKTRDEWQQAALKMTQEKNPYLDFLDVLASQLEPVLAQNNRNPWINAVFEIRSMRKMARQQEGLAKTVGTISKITKKGQRILGVAGRDMAGKAAAGTESMLKAVNAYKDYRKYLAAANPMLVSRKKCFITARDIFTGGGAEENNPILSGLNTVLQIRSFLGRPESSQGAVWQLLQGPVDFCWSYICLETACFLQNQWNQEILSEIQGAADWTGVKGLLLGDKGKVWKFVKGTAGPFIGWHPGKGYSARQVMGAEIPFQPGFFTFLNKGATSRSAARDSYDIFIRGLPTDTNPDASIKPHETRFELQCSAGSQIMVNMNYPVSKKIKWQPNVCGDVVFQINVGNLVLKKAYSGYDGFPLFLKDFRDGQHVFYPQDFPERQDALKRLGIRYIKVQYQFKGSEPILRLLKGIPDRIPEKIVTCWD